MCTHAYVILSCTMPHHDEAPVMVLCHTSYVYLYAVASRCTA